MNFAVILNYMNYKQTIYCVKIVNKVKIQSIIIVDNGSTNDSFEKLQKKFSHEKSVIVLKSKINLGYAIGNNIGIRYINKKFGVSKKNVIFIINPDSIISNNLVTKISNFIITHNDAGAVSGLINNRSSSWRHMQLYRAFLFNFWGVNWMLGKLHISENRYYKLNKNSPNIMKVDVVSGAFFGISQKVLEDINYFDEGTFLYFEEEALYGKLINKGYQNYMITNISYQHSGGTSTSTSIFKLKSIESSSRKYVAKKYHRASNLFLILCSIVNNTELVVLRKLKR